MTAQNIEDLLNSLTVGKDGRIYGKNRVNSELMRLHLVGLKNCNIADVVESKNDSWTDVNKYAPHCWEDGEWDGKRSDYVLTLNDELEVDIARAYSGTMDGSRFLVFFDKHDYELEGINFWMNLPNTY